MSAFTPPQDAAVLEVPVPGVKADVAAMARFQAGLWGGGALMCFLVAVLPHPAQMFTPGFYAVGALAALGALLLWLHAGRLPIWVLHAAAFAGNGLVSLCIFFSGERHGAPATDNEMLYLWVAIYSAYFFTLRQAALQIGWVALTYWIVLAVSVDPSVFPTRWAETVGTLALAVVLVQALRNRMTELVNRLADAARTDPLTGLQNRRGFEETFSTEVERARRHRRPLSVVVGDLDHFKLVNDRLGHPAGDAALVRVGQLLGSARRRIDPVARTGGEEFAVILPEASEREAYLVAERVRSAVEGAFAQKSVPLTMSLGVANFPDHGTNADSLLAAADQALYAAKELGRNRTVIFSDEIASIASTDGGRAATRDVHLATLLALAEVLDHRDTGTANHSQTVGRYSALIAAELGLGPAHVRRIEIAGTLHDIGKIGMPDSILRKPGKLTNEEWQQMQRHPEIGADILGSKHFKDVRSWLLAHHERPDGKGYPHGLSEDEIPLEARILAVADAYEAMTADRVYRRALGAEAARAELSRGAGTQFDPRVVDAFLTALEREARTLAGTAGA